LLPALAVAVAAGACCCSTSPPKDTTEQEPLVFVEHNTKKPKLALPGNLLVNSQSLSPPTAPKEPEFVCNKGWLPGVKDNVEHQLATADGGGLNQHRVGPMALVRCSRGGKTRALYEIANSGVSYSGDPVRVIFVSFNDFSALDHTDQEDPLQALMLRIAFAALKPQNLDSDTGARKTKLQQFSEFREKDYVINETRYFELARRYSSTSSCGRAQQYR